MNCLVGCARCCVCALIAQLAVVACLLAIILGGYLSYELYVKPWGEEHYDEAVAATKAAAEAAAQAVGSADGLDDLDASGFSCGDCLGVNTQFPVSGLSTDATTFQLNVMNHAGQLLSVVTASGVAVSGVGALLTSLLSAASSSPVVKGGVFELLQMVALGQFATLLGALNLEGAPAFFLHFCTKFAWTNLQVFFPDDIGAASAGDAVETMGSRLRTRQRALASGQESVGGVDRYAKMLGVDPDYLFYYTMIAVLAVSGAVVVLYVLARLLLRMCTKEGSRVAEMLDNRVVFVGIQLLLLLQYVLAMTSCFQISYSIGEDRAIGGLILAIIVLIVSCIGIAGFGVYVLSTYKHELEDHGTEEHTLKRFHNRYGALYQDFNKENRYFFLAKLVLDVASGAVVGIVRDPMLQIALLVGFNVVFMLALVVRRPFLLPVFYYVGLAAAYFRVLALVLSLVLVSPDLLPQRVRDLVAQIIICANALVLLCLFARVLYVAVTGVYKWLQKRKQRRLSGSTLDATDMLALEQGVAARQQLRRSTAASPVGRSAPETPPLDATPPSSQAYHQSLGRFDSFLWDRYAPERCDGRSLA